MKKLARAITITAMPPTGILNAREHSPQGHFTIESPAKMSKEKAESAYRQLLPRMRKGYQLADLKIRQKLCAMATL